MKKLIIHTTFDTCYIGENRIGMRFSFVDGIEKCIPSCPEEIIYFEYDENVVSKEEIIKVVEDMDFVITEIE
jgi:copper chaperone CopZ